MALAAHIRKMGRRPEAPALLKLEHRRQRLLNRIEQFQARAALYMFAVRGANEDDGWVDDDLDANASWDGLFQQPEEADRTLAYVDENADSPPEKMTLSLPSTARRLTEAMQQLAQEEIELRVGQANDALQHIRIALGKKAFEYLNMRQNRSQGLKTRAFNLVHSHDSTAREHARFYASARRALEKLGAPEDILRRYRVLKKEDLTVSTAVKSTAERDTRNRALPWIWTMGVSDDIATGDVMKECEYRLAVTQSELSNSVVLSLPGQLDGAQSLPRSVG